ncbi:MAG: NAD(P)-binding protein [Alphaproteobacteria bacterium]|nr:NAD(P)-binding protein [Alphaproteobacteria bacterium]
MKLAIIGGGPAGLSLAYLLKDCRNLDLTIFEAEERVGGKSFTYERAGHAFEMGTCYATRGDRLARKWMKDLGINFKRLGEATFEGTEFYSFAKQAAGPSLMIQGLTYLISRARLLRQLKINPDDPEVLSEAAMPVQDWLRERSLHKMERLFYRGMTTMGYGQPSETATIQGLRWIDRSLLISGMFNDLVMPEEGWSEFWRRIAERLDVRLGHRIETVQRNEAGVGIAWPDGREWFDYVVCAIPIDEFVALCQPPTESEQKVSEDVSWNGFVTTLAAVDDWFEREAARSFAGGILPDAMPGRLLSARFEAYEPELGGRLYMLNQLRGEFQHDELEEIAARDIEMDGGRLKHTLYQKSWKYHAFYKRDAIRKGLLTRLREMQGEKRSFYTGAAFSHEAVSKITQFNTELAARIARIARTHERQPAE